MFDDEGEELNRITLRRGDVRIVAFNTGAQETIQGLPDRVSEAVPDHEALEE